MKFTIQRDAISAFCTNAKGITGAKSPNTFVQSVRVSVENNQLTLSVTDLENWIRQTVPLIEPCVDGVCLVSAEMIGAIANLSNDEKISFTLTGTTAMVVAGSGKFKLNTSDPMDFPMWPNDGFENPCKISGSDFRDALKKVSSFCASEKGRYALNGVLLEPNKSWMEFCGTDGRRLAFVRRPSTGDTFKHQVIIPVSVCSLLQKILPDGDVFISFREESVLVSAGTMEIRSRLVEGQYPDYRSVIPNNLDKKARFEVSEISSALRRANILTSVESQAVRFEFSDGHLSLKSRSPASGEAEVGCPASYAGKLLTIGFDPKYMLGALDCIDAESVEIELRDSDTGAIVHAGHKDLEYYLVMPIDL